MVATEGFGNINQINDWLCWKGQMLKLVAEKLQGIPPIPYIGQARTVAMVLILEHLELMIAWEQQVELLKN